jgi:hypothetical protein
MPDNLKLTGKPMQQRLDDRLQNSGSGAKPDLTVKHGEGARRTYHNLHFSASNEGSSTKQKDK